MENCLGRWDAGECWARWVRPCLEPVATLDLNGTTAHATRTDYRWLTQPATVDWVPEHKRNNWGENFGFMQILRKFTEKIFSLRSFCDFCSSRNSFISRLARIVVSILGTMGSLALLLLLGAIVLLWMRKMQWIMWGRRDNDRKWLTVINDNFAIFHARRCLMKINDSCLRQQWTNVAAMNCCSQHKCTRIQTAEAFNVHRR